MIASIVPANAVHLRCIPGEHQISILGWVISLLMNIGNLRGLSVRRATVTVLLAFISGAQIQLHAQPSPSLDPKFWMTDGPVNALFVTNGAIYVGGDFTYVGPRTGPCGVFDAASGQFLGAPPLVNGVLRAVTPDGQGGWFIGGTFTRVGTSPITNLARLNPDLSLDPRWNAALVGSVVNALVMGGDTLYVGGTIQRVGGKPFGGLVGLDVATAKATWDPQLQGAANALKLSGDVLYVGGNFFSVGASNRPYLAAVRLDTAAATAWNPQPDAQVFAIEVLGNNVYAGGQFATAGTKPRNRLVALDATTGLATAWNPNPNGIVRALAVAGSSVYVGGDFSAIGGQTRRNFGVVNTGNGAAQALDIAIQPINAPVGQVRAMLISGTSLYVGGGLTNALGELHRMVLGLNLGTSESLPTPAASDYNGQAGISFGINALAMAAGKVFVAGDFYSIGGVPRRSLAALSLATGDAMPWSPQAGGPVLALVGDANRIFVGGSFTNMNNFPARGLASVDAFVGTNITSTRFIFAGSNQFSADNTVFALALSTNRLYVGGNFTHVGAVARRFVAGVDRDTGAADTFDAKLGGGFGGVNALLLRGTNLFLAGDFNTVASQTQLRVAAVAAADGALRSWNPAPNQAVVTLASDGANLYLGGIFNQIGGVALKNFAVYSMADFSLQPVDASLGQFSGGVNAIAVTPNTIYVSGVFDAIGGEFRQNLASLAAFNASAYDWDPAPETAPTVLALTEQFAIAGGPNRSLGRSPTNRLSGFLTVFPRGPRVTSLSLTKDGSFHIQTTTSDRVDSVIQTTTDLLSGVWTSVLTNDVPGFPWTADIPAAQPQQFFRIMAR